MSQPASSMFIEDSEYFLEVYNDPFNKRIRVDDYRGNLKLILDKTEKIVHKNNAEKLIMKGRKEDTFLLFELGLQPEAIVDRYYRGSDAYFFAKYYTPERKRNDHWMTEDGIIRSVYQLAASSQLVRPPNDYVLKKADLSDAAELAALYSRVFQIYPTPLFEPEYVKKTMHEGTVYFVFFHQGKIVSAASAEINVLYKNAELTDCATLTEYRKYGLMKVLLYELEVELKKQGIFCAYSIARSQSFGMNAALYQLGYGYRGRLMNNCYIYDKLENMNMWVKHLVDC
ncbi:putative beta-lysine N-acetyltransferase [Bacillus sp. BRMEA1]|uniref:putative beta-lysine N-acetyltransferase n=1 Tax=Neobacillus endophyticus TaxID=2738405 RepID=UPI00156315F9|nr:putative beta-lysine N-acetyltransferase [Neobacillus endophyticus]NRD80455.1 putative beta-lysine N-acetyltransferase [Neobacillus endophyticus]